jgi:hypothetical protein
MLQIDTISKNKGIFNPDTQLQSRNIGIWDLTKSSLTYTGVIQKIRNYKIVAEEFSMRPDRLAYLSYGEISYTGSFMKFNGISNPFAVGEGDIAVFPLKETLDSAVTQKAKLIQKESGTSNPNTQFRKSQEQRKFKTSESRAKFIEMTAKAKNLPPQILPPNLMQEGERQTVRTRSVIALAPDVSNATPNPNANL